MCLGLRGPLQHFNSPWLYQPLRTTLVSLAGEGLACNICLWHGMRDDVGSMGEKSPLAVACHRDRLEFQFGPLPEPRQNNNSYDGRRLTGSIGHLLSALPKGDSICNGVAVALPFTGSCVASAFRSTQGRCIMPYCKTSFTTGLQLLGPIRQQPRY